MDVTQLIGLALADVDEQRIEVTTLEPAEISVEAIGGLAGVLREMARLADTVSALGEKVRVVGSWDQDSYQISISFGGGSTSGDLLDRLFQDPDLALGVASAARSAAQHRLALRRAHDGAIRMTVPSDLVTKTVPPTEPVLNEEPVADFIPHEIEHRVLVATGSPIDETEAFLESVFGALRNPWREPDRQEPAVLQVRVPGESYSVIEDDSPSTAAGEAAVDIRSALSTFDQGRRSAEVSADRVEASA